MHKVKRSTKMLFLILLGVALSEFVIMLFFDLLDVSYSIFVDNIIDSVILIFCLFPLLYFFSLRPYLKEVEERERAAKEARRLAIVVEQSPAEVVVTDKNGVVEYVNPKFVEVTGYKKGDILGKSISILKDNMEASVYEELWKVISRGGSWTGDLRNSSRGGDVFWERASIAPIKDESGRTINYVKVAEDITEIKSAEKMREDFISMVTHELRTPMALAIESVAQVVEKMHGDINEKQNDVLSITSNNLKRLSRIVDDLLDVMKLEAHRMKLDIEQVRIGDLLSKVESLFGPYVKGRGLELKKAAPPSDLIAALDANKMLQVFTNLIGNAVKFTEKGSVEFGASDLGDDISFFVKDTGMGVLPEDRSKLFGRMEQFNTRPVRGEKGTGLGLAICKGIVELHGGRIWAESEVGKGTKISFVIPKQR